MTIFLALQVIYTGFLAVTTIIGVRYGGRSERWGVNIVLLGSIATLCVEVPAIFQWQSNRSALVIVDILVLIAFYCLALKSRRFWPLWATAFHLIAVCSHYVVLMGLSQTLRIYILLQGFWAYPIMLLIILGALSRRQRRTVGRIRAI
jgi:hypothetical protein